MVDPTGVDHCEGEGALVAFWLRTCPGPRTIGGQPIDPLRWGSVVAEGCSPGNVRPYLSSRRRYTSCRWRARSAGPPGLRRLQCPAPARSHQRPCAVAATRRSHGADPSAQIRLPLGPRTRHRRIILRIRLNPVPHRCPPIGPLRELGSGGIGAKHSRPSVTLGVCWVL